MAKIEALEKLRGMRGNGATYEDLLLECCDIADAIQREVDKEFVELPVDVNGEVFHIGDEIVDSTGKRGVVDYIEIRLAEKDTYHYVSFTGSHLRHDPRELHHYHKPTVEDVLLDFVIALDKRGHLSNGVALTIDEFAPKLRMVDDGED